MIAGVIFIAVVIANILGFMLKSEEINREIIYAAILLYLLAALMWAFVYTFLELVDPASGPVSWLFIGISVFQFCNDHYLGIKRHYTGHRSG